MIDTKKCPFCGYTKTRIVYKDWEYTVMCLNCGAFGPNELSRSKALEMWNMRRQEYPHVEKN